MRARCMTITSGQSTPDSRLKKEEKSGHGECRKGIMGQRHYLINSPDCSCCLRRGQRTRNPPQSHGYGKRNLSSFCYTITFESPTGQQGQHQIEGGADNQPIKENSLAELCLSIPMFQVPQVAFERHDQTSYRNGLENLSTEKIELCLIRIPVLRQKIITKGIMMRFLNSHNTQHL